MNAARTLVEAWSRGFGTIITPTWNGYRVIAAGHKAAWMLEVGTRVWGESR